MILQYYKSLPFVYTNIFSNNVVLNTPIRSSYIPVRITNIMRMGVCNYRHVQVRNLVKINISPEIASDKNRNVKKLHLSGLNARSTNNKSLLINDYVVEKQIGILAITETWLKGGNVDDYITWDVCSKGYKYIHCPMDKYGGGGGIGFLFKHNLKIKKSETT